MEALLKQRAHVKGTFTRLENFLNKVDETELDLLQFTAREQCLNEAFIKYTNIQNEIDELDSSKAQEEDRDMTEAKYFNILVRFQKIIQTKSNQNPEGSPKSQIIIQGSQISQSVKLPEIHIPIFSGKLSEWTSFYELFKTLIIDNTQLTDIQRFMYLKSYLKDEPLKLISNLKLTNENFKVALEFLKERYSNKIAIINAHIKNLLEVPSLTKPTAQSLRDFITQIKQDIEALKILNVPVEYWDLLLIYFFTQKIDFNTRRAYEQDKDPNVLPTLSDFCKFLERKSQVLENLSIPNNQTQQKQKVSYHTNVNSNSQSNAQFLRCIFCKQNDHKIYKCANFRNSPQTEKTNFVRSNKLCFNCLGYKHLTKDCTSQGCYFCSGKHHTILHVDKNQDINRSQNSHSTSAQNGNNNYRNSNLTNRHTQNTNISNNTRTFSRNRDNSTDSHRNNDSENNAPRTTYRNINNTQTSQTKNTTVQNNPQTSPHTEEDSQVVSAYSTKNAQVLLATALVTLYSANKQTFTVKALLDGASQTSFITDKVAKQLGYKTYSKNLNISGIGNSNTLSTQIINVTIHSTFDQNVEFKVECAILNKITCKLPQIRINENKFNIPSYVKLADPIFNTPSDIDMLLGADVYYDLLTQGIIKLGKNLPVLQNTHLGWIIAGNIPYNLTCSHISTQKDCTNVSLLVQTSQLDNLLQKFWSLEDIPNSENLLSSEDEFTEKIFKETTQVLENGSYQVNFPLKNDKEHLKLGDSFFIAKKRFLNLEKRFEKNPDLFLPYKDFIDEYLSLGHGKYVPLELQNENNENKYFLPHHCVIKEASATTKLRVVFDGSCKSTTGYSLNDVMFKGYQVQPDLFDILSRFRLYKYALTCDIEKMFRQVRINPCQVFLQNILWRDNPNNALNCIELQTVSFGTNSAPFLATRVLNEIAIRNKTNFPLAAEALLKQCYVDDILYGADTEHDLINSYTQLNNLLNSANFKLHKLHSNSKHFHETLNGSKQETVYDIKIENTSSKVLGLSWNTQFDYLSISVPQTTDDGQFTKREVLSKLAQMFDPLGLIGPVIVVGKIIMQQIWLSKIDWDEQLDSQTLTAWKKFISKVPDLANLKISRYLFDDNKILKVELHGFSDSSIKAYGACIYLRALYENHTVSCNLVTSKSRIAPIKTVSLPRLELCAMLLLSNLTQKIKSILSNAIVVDSVNLWTDSEISLYWIKSHASRWSIFVSNRVSKIQEITADYQWRHVKSAQNPADILSRGSQTTEFIHTKLWWFGPNFLQNFDLDLNDFRFKNDVEDPPEERKITLTVNTNPPIDFWENIFLKFSTFTHLQRAMAYCLRFINNSKQISMKRYGPLSVEELQDSLDKIIIILQGKYFSREIHDLQSNRILSNKCLISLKPFLDCSQILRVGGRLENSDLPYTQKHPALLPSKNHVTTLLLKKEHLRLGHAGAQTVLSNVRLKFWPLNGLREIKRVIKNCITCFRFQAHPCHQIMADLPRDRISVARPFQKVGIDYGGPFFIKSSRLRKAPVTKCYMAIFVCMTTKAVHIELVSNLSTDAFLLTLKRFISRRGQPSIIYTDNATNFLGARNQLKEVYDFFRNKDNSNAIQNFLALNETKWKFIPPRSPHWGGIWEAAVKSAKYHLYRIVGNLHLTFEEFSTVLAQVEAIMNSRPLCALSHDPTDLDYLTSGHFLIGTNLTSYPERDITDVPENRLSFYKKCTQIQQTFWKRWSVDYLSRLQNRPKWLKPFQNLKVNDLVLLKEDNTPPLKWPRARIIEVIPGLDNKVRVVKLKTNGGTFTRSITKICPLPQNDYF